MAKIVALTWYEAAEYPRLRALMDDAERMPDTYAGWLLSAEQVEAEAKRAGLQVVRVTLSPDAFVAWCAQNGLRRDGAARARYSNARGSGSAAPPD